MGDFYYPTRNEDGVCEWMLKDKFGNDIYCYYNGYTELHIKSETKCLDINCGGELYPLPGARWVCGRCGKEYNEKELLKVSKECLIKSKYERSITFREKNTLCYGRESRVWPGLK